MYLRTLGPPVLEAADSALRYVPRKKDLALLIYLCVEARDLYSRTGLASLLWGDKDEDAARHSLTQALGRLERTFPGLFTRTRDQVAWEGGLGCDALQLLAAANEVAEVQAPEYKGNFVEGFASGLGPGAQDFEQWASVQRETLRNAMLRVLGRAGDAAEAAKDWNAALRIGLEAVALRRNAEGEQRRVINSYAELGEATRALEHYEEYKEWLLNEVGVLPDDATRKLVTRIKERLFGRGEAAPIAFSSTEPAQITRVHPEPQSSLPAVRRITDEVDASVAAKVAPVSNPPVDPLPASPALPRDERRTAPLSEPRSPRRKLPLVAAAALIAVLASIAAYLAIPPVPKLHSGESITHRGTSYLVYQQRLYAYPDFSTLSACTGAQPALARKVARLPAWERTTLPSVRSHSWMGARSPVQAGAAYYTVNGCVRVRIPRASMLDSIFIHTGLRTPVAVDDSVLARLPEAAAAQAYPLRPAGTLVRTPAGMLRWIVHHGGALSVDHTAALRTYCRSVEDALDLTAAEVRSYVILGPLPAASPPVKDCLIR